MQPQHWSGRLLGHEAATREARQENRLRIFSGTANPQLAQLQESVRGCDVFLVQPTCPPANENLMELLVMIDACRRASAKNITAVIPYFGYARADRKTQGRESIAAKLVANLITEAGANRVLACDLHSGQSMGYFDIPVDHVYGQTQGRESIAAKLVANLITEAGANRVLACDLHSGQSMGYFDIPVDHVYGQASWSLSPPAGCLPVSEAIGRVLFASPPAIQRLSGGLFQEVIITNTIPLKEENLFPQLTVLSVANLLGETIWRVHDDTSVSSIFR
eukprot:jgi/Mesen1/4847/ME000244S04026